MRLVKPVCDYEPFETPHGFIEQGTPQKDEYPLVPEGSYQVQFICADRPVNIFGPEERRLFLHWQVIDSGPYFEVKLFQSFKHYKKWPFSSKYYCNWTLANGRKPRTRTRMSPEIFNGKIFSAHIRTVKPKYRDGPLKGKEKPEAMWYSIVDELLRLIVGS